MVYHSHMASAPPCIGIYNCEATNCSYSIVQASNKVLYLMIRDCIQHFTQGQNVSLPTTISHIMHLSMVYAPPYICRADVGEKRGGCRQNLPQGVT